MEVLVVGAGTMGRWVAECVLDAGGDVAFADRDAAVADRAAEALDGRTVPVDGAETFDAVCLAVPMSVVEDAIAEHAARADRAVLDVSGVMTGPVEAMERAAPDLERASVHPLFAPTNEPGNVAWVAAEPGPLVGQLRDAVSARGNHVFETTPAEHDRAMETVQARAHAAVLAYALAAEEVPPEFHTPLSGPLEELVDQITGKTPRVYREIQSTFPGAVDVAEAAHRLADADDATFDDLYREASEHRTAGQEGSEGEP